MPRKATRKTLWRLGTPGMGSGQFALAHELIDPDDAMLRTDRAACLPDAVEVVVGDRQTARHWPFIHPGPKDVWAGAKARPYTIAFDLSRPAPPCVELAVHYVGINPETDVQLCVAVNGEPARLHLPAGRPGDAPDVSTTDAPPPLRLSFDGRLLKRGRNRITLTNDQGSWTLYDCVELCVDSARDVEPGWWVDGVVSLPFYARRARGSRQLVEIRTTNLGARRRVHAELEIAGQRVRRDITLPLGPGRTTVEVKPWEGAQPACADLEDRASRSQWSGSLEPGRQYTLYLVQHAHTRVGSTHPPLQCAEIHATNLDRVIRFCEQTEDWPEPSRFKWAVEASWALDHFLSTRPPRQIQRLLYWIEAGRIGVEAMYVQALTGLCTTEELIRLLYTSGSIRRLYELPVTTAMMTDVPGGAWFLPEALVRSGVRYLSIAMGCQRPFCHADAPPHVPAFYWEGPAGARLLTWICPSDTEGARYGFRTGADGAYPLVRELLGRIDRQTDPLEVVCLRASFGDNAMADMSQARTVREWNKRWAWPRAVLATSHEFFTELEARYRDRLPTCRGDWAGWAEHGAGSDAVHTHINRANHRVLVEAEKWQTLAMMLGLLDYPGPDINQAYKYMILFDEHTWGASAEVAHADPDQAQAHWQFKTDCCESARMISQRMLDDALEAIAAHVDCDRPYCVVFNSSAYARQDTVLVGVPRELMGPENLRMMDLDTDAVLPTQFVDEEEESATCIVSVPELPPLGFRVLAPSPEISGSGPTLAVADELVNDWYRLRVDPETGAVASLYDKSLRHELVDHDSPYGFGTFIYHLGLGDSLRQRLPEQVTLRPGMRGPVFDELSLRYACGECPQIDLRIWLYHHVKKVELRWWIEKEPTDEKEAGYVMFPFSVPDGVFHAELAGAILQPGRDQIAGACRRWYAVQHWVDCSNDHLGATLAVGGVPLVQFGGITTHDGATHLDGPPSTVAGYLFNNYGPAHFPPSQAGPFQVTYAITSHAGPFDPVAATRFGDGFGDPATVAVWGRPDADPLLASQATALVTVEPEHVRLLTVKQVESGAPVLMRLQELSGRHTVARITLGFTQLGSAEVADHLEEPTHPLTVEQNTAVVELDPHEVVTVLLYPTDEDDPPIDPEQEP